MKSKTPLPKGAAKTNSTKKPKTTLAPKTKKHAGGRPTKYNARYPEMARKFCLLGADDKRLADLFEVQLSTINNWKTSHPEFLESIKDGKDRADAAVAASMYHRAIGYSHKAVKIFADVRTGAEQIVEYDEHYPPDPTSGIFWLKNRQKEKWRDKQDHEHTGANGGPIPVATNASDFTALEEKLAKFAIAAPA